jgi:hypothetical protein
MVMLTACREKEKGSVILLLLVVVGGVLLSVIPKPTPFICLVPDLTYFTREI